MGKKKSGKRDAKEVSKKRSRERSLRPLSPVGTPDELAIAVLTTTPKELKEWERTQSKKE